MPADDGDHRAQPPGRVAVVVVAGRRTPGGATGAGEDAALRAAMLADRLAHLADLRGALPAVALERDPDVEATLSAFLADGVPILLVDSDSPTLPRAYLEEAVERLRDPSAPVDLVLGPADGGGVYLLGLGRPVPELLRLVPWGAPQAATRLLASARGLGLGVHVLPRWWTVDGPDGLERLRASLLDATWPARTAAWLLARDERLRGAAPEPPVAPGDLWNVPWRTIASRPVYATPWLEVREDRVARPDGRLTRYGVVRCGECVGVLPFVDRDHVLLVRQFRYVAGRATWEMPTGGVHAGETPEAAVARELAEEARVSAARFQPLGRYHTSKSVMDETARLFVAHDLSPVDAGRDESEFIRVETVPFERVLGMVLSGEILDGMTIVAVLRVAFERARGG